MRRDWGDWWWKETRDQGDRWREKKDRVTNGSWVSRFIEKSMRERERERIHICFLVFIFLFFSLDGVVNQGQQDKVYLSNHMQCTCHFLYMSIYQSNLQATIGFVTKLCFSRYSDVFNLMWRLVLGNVFGFPRMFQDSLV